MKSLSLSRIRSSLSAIGLVVLVLPGLLTGAETPRPTPEPTPPTKAVGDGAKTPAGEAAATLSAVKIKALRDAAAKVATVPADTPEGWSKSPLDPAKVVEAFPPLHVRKGFALRAYQYKTGGNGNGYVWAMPADVPFLEPGDCATVDRTVLAMVLKVPKPADAVDAMEGIEGDGSPASYLAASLASRQLGNFGALWHGSNWSLHAVLDADPRQAASPQPGGSPMLRWRSKPDDWKWLQPAPKSWAPEVRVEKDAVTVTFYTFCPLRKETIYIHVDTYKPGSLQAKGEDKPIAEGLGGIML
jgi:hypothetical protein